MKNAVADQEDSGTMSYKIAVAERRIQARFRFKLPLRKGRIQARCRIKLPLRSRVEVLTLRFSSQVSSLNHPSSSYFLRQTSKTCRDPKPKKNLALLIFPVLFRPLKVEGQNSAFKSTRSSLPTIIQSGNHYICKVTRVCTM